MFFPKGHTINSILKKNAWRTAMTLLGVPKVQAMKRFIIDSQLNTLFHLFSTILMIELSERHFETWRQRDGTLFRHS